MATVLGSSPIAIPTLQRRKLARGRLADIRFNVRDEAFRELIHVRKAKLEQAGSGERAGGRVERLERGPEEAVGGLCPNHVQRRRRGRRRPFKGGARSVDGFRK